MSETGNKNALLRMGCNVKKSTHTSGHVEVDSN